MIGRITALVRAMMGRGNRPQRTVLVTLYFVAGIVLGYWLQAVPAAPDPVALKVQGPDTIGNLLPVQIQGTSGTGSLQTAVTATAAGANANTTATLPAVANKTTYISGFQVTSNGATASASVVVALTGVISGTNNFVYVSGALNTAGDGQLIVTFNPPVPSSAQNTAISVGVPALGAGNTQTQVSVQGFYQ